MKLHAEFVRLPLRFDVEQLRAEMLALPESAWHAHPNAIPGNSAVRLISVGGGENDDVSGAMTPTEHLKGSPYITQILKGFNTVWGRSRLMRLAPGAQVPEHCDINYHWFHRVRLHIPIVTDPAVRFRCGDAELHMSAGEAWVFDSWRLHAVFNDSAVTRVHLVADTTGSAAFWNLCADGRNFRSTPDDGGTLPVMGFRPELAGQLQLSTEQHNTDPVMHPSEVALLAEDLRADLGVTEDTADARQSLTRMNGLLNGLIREWRSLWSQFGAERAGWPYYRQLRENIRSGLRMPGPPVFAASNSINAARVLESRILDYLLDLPGEKERVENEYGAKVEKPAKEPAAQAGRSAPAIASAAPIMFTRQRIQRPLIVVATPRSGSTLLFETLSQVAGVYTVGGETHTLFEADPRLRPGAPGVDSNRLDASHALPELLAPIRAGIEAHLRDRDGQPAPADAIRFLEKTPKNALRIPFLNALYPDALYVHLWREPRSNLASIMEAWRSGRWVTYPQLSGWEGPWSLLLPPDWQSLRGRPLEEIAAHQWRVTNETILGDLSEIQPERQHRLSYAELTADPSKAVAAICDFAGWQMDQRLRDYLARPLPLSRYTQSAPDQDKWLRQREPIERMLPELQAVVASLQAGH